MSPPPLTTGWIGFTLEGAGASSATLRAHTPEDSATTCRTASFTIDLASARAGETLTFQAFGGGDPSAEAFIDSIVFEVVAPAIAPLADTASPAEMARAISAPVAAVQRGVPGA